jgi:hypothetical protein
VALYSTTHKPVVECSLIGFVQPAAAAAGSATEVEDADGIAAEGSAAAAAAAGAGGKDSSSNSGVQLHAAFAPLAGKAKAVLSVGISHGGSWGLVRNVPMYF